MPDDSYLKYYWLENEFFPEIRKFFDSKGYLKPEQFFYIIIWKSNYNKPSIKWGLSANKKSLDREVYDLTRKIDRAHSKEERLEILIGNGKGRKNQDGFQLAMASAVLTILYPEIFSVYDRRVRSQLKHPKKEGKKFPDISYSRYRTRRYFEEYIPQVLRAGREISKNSKLSLRDCDRLLWAKSRHEELQNFLKVQPNSPQTGSGSDARQKKPGQ